MIIDSQALLFKAAKPLRLSTFELKLVFILAHNECYGRISQRHLFGPRDQESRDAVAQSCRPSGVFVPLTLDVAPLHE